VKIWVDGALVDEREARISPLDHGVTVGDGVFETVRVYAGVPFAWTRHDERIRRSADALGIDVLPSPTLRDAVRDVLAANGLARADARVRVTITAGEGPPGSAAAFGKPVTFVVATPLVALPPTVAVVLAPWTRNPGDALAGLKTTSYAGNVRALAYAAARGAGEALFCDTAGRLCEATGSNLFVVRDDVLSTPGPDTGCLLGVTRALLLELAPAVGLRVEDADLVPDDLLAADEVFLSSTVREVQLVDRIDGRQLVARGDASKRLAAAFAELVMTNPDP
jgi:branched-chain amino acid aminotransferase